MKYIGKSLLALFFVASCAGSLLAQPNIEQGKTIFKNNCANCHVKDMVSRGTGPALGGVEERWAEYPREELYAWIRNSQASIASGQPRAVELWEEWQPTVMNNFTALTDEEIESLLLYIDDQYQKTLAGPQVADAGAAAADGQEEGRNNTFFIILFGVLIILALVMWRIIRVLNNIATTRETGQPAEKVTLIDLLTSKTVIGIALFAIVVLGGYTTVNNAINLGRQQGYAPEQPIKFSHATHAGLQKIDCQYCHDGARRSKHSVIPAANTCMNCHRVVKVGSKYGTQEISKIYASIGYDPIGDRYYEDYEELATDSVERIYKGWIEYNYRLENGIDEEEELDRKGKRLLEEQWNEIFASLTNEQKEKVQGPIEWIRIHNLPDHVYFNHAQHVTAGQLECQQCHGKVEEMELLGQYSPLSMGWCINCHRQTEVQGFKEEDGYYANTYTDYHNALKVGDKEKITVEDIGGLECQKCHY